MQQRPRAGPRAQMLGMYVAASGGLESNYKFHATVAGGFEHVMIRLVL